MSMKDTDMRDAVIVQSAACILGHVVAQHPGRDAGSLQIPPADLKQIAKLAVDLATETVAEKQIRFGENK